MSGIIKCGRLLLQSASGITKCDRLYCKVRQVLQSATVILKSDVTNDIKANLKITNIFGIIQITTIIISIVIVSIFQGEILLIVRVVPCQAYY